VCAAFAGAGHEVVPWDIALSPDHDLRVAGCLTKVLPTVDFVIFLAFDVGGAKYITDASTTYMDNNLLLMHHTFLSLQQCPRPFIYTTSTMSSMTHLPYAVLKRLSEFYTDLLGGVCIKLWNVYGQEPICIKSHVIPDLIDQASTGDAIRLRTDGHERRLFLHADDFARAVLAVFDHFDVLRGRGIVDVSSSEWVSILDVAYLIQHLARDKGRQVDVQPSTVKDGSHTHFSEPDLALISEVWSPRISLEDGIRAMFLI